MWSHLLIRWIDQQTLPMGELFNTPRRTHAMCLQTRQLTAQHSNNRERACVNTSQNKDIHCFMLVFSRNYIFLKGKSTYSSG